MQSSNWPEWKALLHQVICAGLSLQYSGLPMGTRGWAGLLGLGETCALVGAPLQDGRAKFCRNTGHRSGSCRSWLVSLLLRGRRARERGLTQSILSPRTDGQDSGTRLVSAQASALDTQLDLMSGGLLCKPRKQELPTGMLRDLKLHFLKMLLTSQNKTGSAAT